MRYEGGAAFFSDPRSRSARAGSLALIFRGSAVDVFLLELRKQNAAGCADEEGSRID